MSDADNDGAMTAVEEGRASGASGEQGVREDVTSAIALAWDEGVASGPASDGEEAFARIRLRLASRSGFGR